jgi:hypothetical protein
MGFLGQRYQMRQDVEKQPERLINRLEQQNGGKD